MVLGQADWQKVMNAIGVLRPAGSHNDFFAAVIRLGTFDFLALTNAVCAFLHFLEVEGLLEKLKHPYLIREVDLSVF